MVNFSELKKIYNNYMDMLLSCEGLTTKCFLEYGISKPILCNNCLYDPNLNRSANKYKTSGPQFFADGQICPSCNGQGYYGENKLETIYIAIIWDYKKWINISSSVVSDGRIQTICNKNLTDNFKRCKSLLVPIPSSNNEPQKFVLDGEPNPAGLGDNNYIICMWKKIS